MKGMTVNQIWTGRLDAPDGPEGLRWHQVVRQLDLSQPALSSAAGPKVAVSFLGFCCDEGIRRNQGRVGAATGPSALRQATSNLAVHFGECLELHDVGDVACRDGDLGSAQAELASGVKRLLAAGYFPMLLGGGHEIAYGHFAGIAAAWREGALQDVKRIGIINLDAHFDLRSYSAGPNSGTPFLQAADLCKQQGLRFNYLCLGIQEASNTRQLFRTAKELGVEYVPASQLRRGVDPIMAEHIRGFLDRCDAFYLTLDLDVFAAAYAPGVSASNPTGLAPEDVMEMLHLLIQTRKLLSAEVAELSPPFDIDNRTAKLAAMMIYELVMGLATNRPRNHKRDDDHVNSL